ncbi:hypothetical protein HU200_032636 [Digitaria exilis]|uniref:C2 domain-containing protein n=1 Tax=Digitaria exilis TaxID=1010633 RepID=A0A835ELG3_9POAL|nr:hypothetical protein HU200_032636 [Digitaria exilis]
MAQGTLEVLLVGAKGLENTDYLSMSPFLDRSVHPVRGNISLQILSGSTALEKWHQFFLTSFMAGCRTLEVICQYNLVAGSALICVSVQLLREYWKGCDPEWNETFVFTVSDSTTELFIKLLDSDGGTDDDFVGEATIALEAVYTERSIPPTVYNVVKDEEYRGEIKIGLTFTPEVICLT